MKLVNYLKKTLASLNLTTDAKNYCPTNEMSGVCLKEPITEQKNTQLKNISVEQPEFVPTGHFYSAIPSKDDRISHLSKKRSKDDLCGIELSIEKQLQLVKSFSDYYSDIIKFPEKSSENTRYFFENPAYSWGDAIFLHCMIRHNRPKKIIEVGCGYSSAMIYDTNKIFFNNSIKILNIEPYPELLIKMIGDPREENGKIIKNKIQLVDLSIFEQLESGDILFVDSTHVSKLGSDVNYIFFQILPRIKPGVIIHFHDIFFNFEYPDEWISEGRVWNEGYILRAFLEYNNAFEILLFTNYLAQYHKDYVYSYLPAVIKNPGASMWIRKKL